MSFWFSPSASGSSLWKYRALLLSRSNTAVRRGGSSQSSCKVCLKNKATPPSVPSRPMGRADPSRLETRRTQAASPYKGEECTRSVGMFWMGGGDDRNYDKAALFRKEKKKKRTHVEEEEEGTEQGWRPMFVLQALLK